MKPTIPRHIAIVMDGNGRWAQSRGHARFFGHARGASRVKGVVREADRLGVKAVTLFAFSTENWSRPEAERSVLWKLLIKYLKQEASDLLKNNVRLRVIGELERLDPKVRDAVNTAITLLSKNTGLELNFAVSYGSRSELVRAAQLFAEDCVQGRAVPASLDEKMMWSYLWTRDLGDLAEVDLVIRTSGEKRTSNYLLWQSAYAEYVFSDVYWPDFSETHLRQAVEEYQQRDRRFGGVQQHEKI